MKKLTTCVILLVLVPSVLGQSQTAKPDLSGTWRLVESRNVRQRSSGTFEKTLLVTQHEPEVQVNIKLNENGRERSLDQVYFSDNRGETNQTFNENQTIRSRTRWRDGRLEIRRTESMTLRSPTGGTKTVRIEIKEEWELSKDRSRLTQTTTVSSSGASRVVNEMSGDRSPAVEVFARVEQ